jgi:hypothetical protein
VLGNANTIAAAAAATGMFVASTAVFLLYCVYSIATHYVRIVVYSFTAIVLSTLPYCTCLTALDLILKNFL